MCEVHKVRKPEEEIQSDDYYECARLGDGRGTQTDAQTIAPVEHQLQDDCGRQEHDADGS